MDGNALFKHKMLNIAQSTLLIGLLSFLIGYVSLIIAGEMFALFSFILVIFIYKFNQFIASNIVLRIYRGYELNYYNSRKLFSIFQELVHRAGLNNLPKLYIYQLML